MLAGLGLLSLIACGRSGATAPNNTAPNNTAPNKLAPSATATTAGPLPFVQDLDGRMVAPLPRGPSQAIVFVFLRIDCPISNRYAPEVRRLHEEFASRGVAFRLVFPDAGDTGPAIRKHLAAFQWPGDAVGDPQHALAHSLEVRTTPEAVVLLGDGLTQVYRGRIDDRYVDFGVARPQPTSHDLEEAIESALTGRSVVPATTPAIGCPIVDAP